MAEEKINNTKIDSNNTSCYRSIFKATSIFGGVQVYQILIGVIKSKFIAVLLGPVGMGVQGLYQSAIQVVQGLTNLGLSQSAVRDVSEAYGSNDENRIGHTVSVVKRLVWFTGLLGLLVTICLSPILSKSSFGNYDHIIPFIALSITVLLDQLTAGQKVIIQGTRKIKLLAKATAVGATIGMLCSVPLYYFMGLAGIIPAFFVYSIVSLFLSYFYSHKIKIKEVQVSLKDSFQGGKSMLKLGIAMSINAILINVFSYILRAFIRHTGGIEEVGLFTAGFTILNVYVGMVFNAMSTDYFPRLSAINKDNNGCKTLINQQAEVALLILSPIVFLCIILMPFLIRLIYSEDFLAANDYISWAVLGLMFKCVSWVIAFIFLAKSESKLFVVNETITQIYSLVLQLVGYFLFGLSGLGIAFTLSYIIYCIQVYIIAHKKYEFIFSDSMIRCFIILFVMVSAGFALIHILNSAIVYIPLTLLLVLCSWYSIKELNERMDFLSVLNSRLKK